MKGERESQATGPGAGRAQEEVACGGGLRESVGVWDKGPVQDTGLGPTGDTSGTCPKTETSPCGVFADNSHGNLQQPGGDEMHSLNRRLLGTHGSSERE